MSDTIGPSKPPVGTLGEDFVEWACHAPFGKDFLFRGQTYRDASNHEIELCDLLLLLDDTAVLMEVKTADREKRPNRTDEEWSDWANARLKKALSQIERGVNAIRSGLVKTVENERQGQVPVDAARIKHFYSIAIVDHPQLDKVGKGPTIDIGDVSVSVLTTTHAELSDLLTELSTPGDLIEYLRAREAFFEKNMLMGITELDLLAVYKGDPDQFRRNVADHDDFIIGEGCWEEFSKLEARKRRDEMDKPSLLVDAIIDILHEARHAQLPHIEERRARLEQPVDPRGAYAKIAAELAKIRRIDRRLIGEGLIEKSQKCIEQKRDRWFANSPMTRDAATIVFMVSTSSREERMKLLQMLAMGAMLKFNVNRVVGIAIEPVMGGRGSSVDAFMIAGDPEEYLKAMSPEMREHLLKQFGTPRKPDVTEFGGPAGPTPNGAGQSGK